jgi:predicted ester cyclase
MTGTNSGAMGPMPATNKSFKINGIDIILVKDGKATDRWGVFDDMSLMTQLGTIPSANSSTGNNK